MINLGLISILLQHRFQVESEITKITLLIIVEYSPPLRLDLVHLFGLHVSRVVFNVLRCFPLLRCQVIAHVHYLLVCLLPEENTEARSAA